MVSYRNNRRRDNRTALMVLSGMGLLLLMSAVVLTQTVVTVNSIPVDASKPEPVVLHITNVDSAFFEGLASVKVGDVAGVQFSKDPQKGEVTINPPPNLSGVQLVQLLDTTGTPLKDKNVPLKSIELRYQSTGGSGRSANGSPTPDINWVNANNVESRRNILVQYWWYYPLISGSFVLFLLVFICTIARGIWFARATYRSPAGLPVGSFRAILAYTLVLFLGFYVLASLLSFSYFSPPESILGIVATVIGFYFGSRSDEQAGGPIDPRTGIVRGIVRKGPDPVIGATVRFKTSDGREPYVRITRVDGQFDVRGVPPGKYKVSVTGGTPPATGEQDISVTGGSDQEIEILLKTPTEPPLAAQTGSVNGTVSKPDGTPAAQTVIKLLQGEILKGDAKSDDKGNFKFEGLTPGDYVLRAEVSGTLSSPQPVKISAGGVTKVEIKLTQ